MASALALSHAGLPSLLADDAPPSGIGKPQTMSSKIGGYFKSSADKAKSLVTPKADEPVDPLLSKSSSKPTPEFHVALAQLHERTEKMEEAEAEYKKALKLKANDRDAMVGYAHLKDRQNELNDAISLYKAAAAKHPKDAAIFNDLGLCYHRRGLMRESAQALYKAVELKPDRALYRNNLATVLVEQGDIDGALTQLKAVHGSSAAHYNLGFLLHRKGDNDAALTQFQLALAENPTMPQAHAMIARLAPAAPRMSPEAGAPMISQSQANTYRPMVRPMPRIVQPAPQASAPEPQAITPQPLQVRQQDSGDGRYGDHQSLQYPQNRAANEDYGLPPSPGDAPAGPDLTEALPPVE